MMTTKQSIYFGKEWVVYDPKYDSIATVEQQTLFAMIRYKSHQAKNIEAGDMIVNSNLIENFIENHDCVLLGELC